MADTEQKTILERVIGFINEMDDNLEAALAQYGDFIPDELRPTLNIVDEGLDKIVAFLTPFSEEQPIRTLLGRIRERLQARRAAREAKKAGA